MNDQIERRYMTAGPIEIRAKGDKNHLTSYAIRFNELSASFGGWKERILPGCLDAVMNNDLDCRCLFNHEPSQLLGRTLSKTLSLQIDKNGLAYDCMLPDTQLGRDIQILHSRGDLAGSSFAFRTAKDRWLESPDGELIREIVEIAALYDVGPATYPAYPTTDPAYRSLDLFKKIKNSQLAIRQQILALELAARPV